MVGEEGVREGEVAWEGTVRCDGSVLGVWGGGWSCLPSPTRRTRSSGLNGMVGGGGGGL